FRDDEEHRDCWHFQVGLRSGKVLKKVLPLAKKAEMLAAEFEIDPELFAEENDVPRLWVKADPCERFPNGCELAVEPACLVVPGKSGRQSWPTMTPGTRVAPVLKREHAVMIPGSFVTRWNLDAIEAAYQQWQADPQAVDPSWRLFFEGFDLGASRTALPAADS